MNKKVLLFVVLVIIGLADAILNLWAFLLNHETMSLLMAAVGVLIVIVGIVQIRREMNVPKSGA